MPAFGRKLLLDQLLQGLSDRLVGLYIDFRFGIHIDLDVGL